MSKKTRTKKKRNRELLSEKHAPERYVVPGPKEPLPPDLRKLLQEQAARLMGLIRTSANYGDVKMLNRLAQTANRVKNEEIEEWERGLMVDLPSPGEEGDNAPTEPYMLCRVADTCMFGCLKAVQSVDAPDPDLSDVGEDYEEDC